LMLALIGFYAVLFDGNISGGIPFIPESANQIFGKAFILIGAIFTGVLAIIAFKEFFEYGRYQKKK